MFNTAGNGIDSCKKTVIAEQINFAESVKQNKLRLNASVWTLTPSFNKQDLDKMLDRLDDEVIDEVDASTNAKRKSYILRRRPFKPETSAFITNRKANQCLYSNLAPIEAEIEVLTRMLIKMGIISMSWYRMYWANQTRVDVVANCISRNRFEALLRFLYFNDNNNVIMDRNHPNYVRLYKVRPLLENIRQICLEETPGELQSPDVEKNRFVHDFWLCDGMAPKLENPIGFFGANVVLDRIHSVATIRSNRLCGCPVMPFNELKQRGRGDTDFCRTKDNKGMDPVESVRRWDKRQRH
ncbi:hypothetical protein T10_8091 [Trichinella papuae]|uniref:PiggyBac transposable element-derived protein domain-containing protein n=1 Tax=Trichinella papuae TaxID=268474 RepID=A0A0V1MDB1_9BILA|nr:hypothetical protein T10_8091 [Trichinella papuae]